MAGEIAVTLRIRRSGGRAHLLALVALWAWLAATDPCLADAGQSVVRSLEVGGLTRTYRLYAPQGIGRQAPAALLFAFHGGGGDGVRMERLTAFTSLAHREGFLVVYPDGKYKNWNDGREAGVSRTHRENLDDLGFIAALLDALTRDYRIDPARVFSTGISNGAIFSHFLAAKLSPRIAAIAPVVGGIADPFQQTFNPDRPVSVLILQGTADPLVPYDGGGIIKGRRGRIISTEEAARLWAQHNGCRAAPVRQVLPERDPTDGCRVIVSTWSRCREGTEVALYSLEGGGHTWPGGSQYLPEFVIGKVCREFDATALVWDFFKGHPRP